MNKKYLELTKLIRSKQNDHEILKCLLRPKLSLLSMNFTSITQIFMIVDLNPWLW